MASTVFSRARVSRLRKMGVAGVASTGLAASLVMGFGTATAHADVLDQLAQEFSTGAGAGTVANLLSTSLTLKAQGYKPKPGDLARVKAALDKRPNQGPLIDALNATISNQQNAMEQAGGNNTSLPPLVSVNQGQWNPMHDDDPSVFPMPGRENW